MKTGYLKSKRNQQVELEKDLIAKGLQGIDQEGKTAFVEFEDLRNRCNNSYSFSEKLTGGKWTNGKPIYRKVISGNITDITKLVLISNDVDEICTHSGTGNLGSSSGFIIALPNYSIHTVDLSIGQITQRERYYEFSGDTKPTHVRINSFDRQTTNSGGQLIHVGMRFTIIVDYTKIT